MWWSEINHDHAGTFFLSFLFFFLYFNRHCVECMTITLKYEAEAAAKQIEDK